MCKLVNRDRCKIEDNARKRKHSILTLSMLPSLYSYFTSEIKWPIQFLCTCSHTGKSTKLVPSVVYVYTDHNELIQHIWHISFFFCQAIPVKTLMAPWTRLGLPLVKAIISCPNNSGQASGQSQYAIADITYA